MPLVIPAGASRIGKIIGIDPGSNCLGFACIEYDLVTLEIIRTFSFTIKPERCLRSDTISDAHGVRYARITKLTNIIAQEFRDIAPNEVVCESPFMSRRQPMAYGALMEVVYAVRLALIEYDDSLSLNLIDPPRAKQAVNAAGNAGKEDVLKAILAMESELKFDKSMSNGKDLKDLDEHSSDGLAIAKSLLNIYRG